MEDQIRLDKMLANLGIGSRKEIKAIVRKGLVQINGQVVTDSAVHVQPQQDQVTVQGELVEYRKFVYVMLNKPAGVVSATYDRRDQTVVELIDEAYAAFEVFPVGRLDKDTEGLLLLTNDGQLAHRLLAPKKHIPKTYQATIQGEVTSEDVLRFQQGVILDDGYQTLPADLKILVDGPVSQVEITIYEGKFHQIKRMFAAVDKEVIYLKRIAMGKLVLDEHLALGESRELSAAELALLTESRV